MYLTFTQKNGCKVAMRPYDMALVYELKDDNGAVSTVIDYKINDKETIRIAVDHTIMEVVDALNAVERSF